MTHCTLWGERTTITPHHRGYPKEIHKLAAKSNTRLINVKQDGTCHWAVYGHGQRVSEKSLDLKRGNSLWKDSLRK